MNAAQVWTLEETLWFCTVMCNRDLNFVDQSFNPFKRLNTGVAPRAEQGYILNIKDPDLTKAWNDGPRLNWEMKWQAGVQRRIEIGDPSLIKKWNRKPAFN